MANGTVIKNMERAANASFQEKAHHDRDRIKAARKSPDVRNMFCLKVGTANFYFVSEEGMNTFWNGDEHTKGYRQKLIEENGQEYFENLQVETFKK